MKRGTKKIFGREMQQRRAFLRSLMVALVEHGHIRTTETRAKVLARNADKVITKAKRGTLAARRLLVRQVGVSAAEKLVKEIAPKFADRHGGYTRVLKLGQRSSDSAPLAIVEFTS